MIERVYMGFKVVSGISFDKSLYNLQNNFSYYFESKFMKEGSMYVRLVFIFTINIRVVFLKVERLWYKVYLKLLV